jgi:tetratricopeptide (TPR) repeat protein
VLLLLLVLLGGVLAGSWYAQHQWHEAQTALAVDRPREARDRLAFCLFVWPRSLEAHRLAARAARMSGDVAAAEAHLNQCIKLHGGATESVQLEFLLLRVQTGEVDEVSPLLIDLIEKGHPESPIILDTLARAYMHLLRYKPAFACLTRWIEIQPEAARAYQWRGWVLERLNRAKAAAQDYERALELDPDLMLVRLRVAEMLLEDKRVPEAVPHLERLYRQAPDNSEVQARLGTCRFYQNQTQEARRLMEAALPQLPRDAPLLISLAKLDFQEGRATDAEQRLRQAIQIDPSEYEALYTLVSVLQSQGRAKESAGILKEYQQRKERVDRANKLLQEIGDNPTAGPAEFAEIGDLLMSTGREHLGVYWLQQALERDPAHRPAHLLLADYYEKKGDHAKAESHRHWLLK